MATAKAERRLEGLARQFGGSNNGGTQQACQRPKFELEDHPVDKGRSLRV
jgi:hypothetical protein